ncbi:hypothetical protein [Paraburkholderia nodosa]|uniref:hypothetical protein n=1 Tax=Paraburkholderia nodosa TaxID=392320 RepID=UPI0004890263|nr:hypothetical protein [Paraburkholderia nodosa]
MNCEAGQMAIIVGTRCTPENLGRIVDVVSRATCGEAFVMTNGVLIMLESPEADVWRIRSDVPLKWRAENGEMFEAYEIATGDRFLLPVTGLQLDADVRDEVSA